MLAKKQVRFSPVSKQAPPGLLSTVQKKPAGSASVIWTFVAGAGPFELTTIEKPICEPALIELLSAVLTTPTSGVDGHVIAIDAVDWLLFGFESFGVDTYAVFVTVPGQAPAVVGAVMCSVRDVP